MKLLHKHKIYYAVLFVVVVFGVFLLLQNGLSKDIKVWLAVLLCLFYSLFGILHHVMHHNTTAKVVVEYVLIGVIGFLLINFLLQNSF